MGDQEGPLTPCEDSADICWDRQIVTLPPYVSSAAGVAEQLIVCMYDQRAALGMTNEQSPAFEHVVHLLQH